MKKKSILILLIMISFLLISCGKVEKTYYKVIFDYGYDDIIVSVEVVDGTTVEKPENPERDGYTFDNWYLLTGTTIGSNPYKFNNQITKNITIIAVWDVNVDELAIIRADLELVKNEFDNKTITDNIINFPNRGEINNTRLSYSSSNPGVVTNRGYVINPSVTSNDVSVDITVSSAFGNSRDSMVFTITIPPIHYNENVTETLGIPFLNKTTEYSVLEQNLKTYFTENNALPYVDIKDFIDLLGEEGEAEGESLIYSDELEYLYDSTLNELTISYEITYTNDDDIEETDEYNMYINFDNNIITLETLDFFEGYIKTTATDYADKLEYLPSYYEEATGITFDLNKYNINIFTYEEDNDVKYLFPMHFANLLFTYGTYYNVYYNGDNYYGIYAYPEKDVETEMKESSLNETKIPYEIEVSTYHMLAFTFDYLYGLKDIKGVDSYYDLLINYANNLVSGNSAVQSRAIFDFVYKTIDESHTSHVFYGLYSDQNTELPIPYINDGSVRGPYILNWSKGYISVTNAFNKAFLIKAPNYRFLDEEKTTAVINLESFDTAAHDDPTGKDSDRFMENTLNAIFNENPNVENIAIDLSRNGGGNIGALFRVLGYISEKPLEVSYQNPTDGANITYFVQVETEAYEDINWFVITSPITFSAANLMTAIVKNQNMATVIGQNSFGGASSITPILLPDGSMISISSLNVLSIRIDNGDGTYTYQDIEYGIPVDYQIPNSDLYKDEVLLATILSSFES